MDSARGAPSPRPAASPGESHASQLSPCSRHLRICGAALVARHDCPPDRRAGHEYWSRGGGSPGRGIAHRLTHLIATNKPRTVETLAALAAASGLGGDHDGDGVPDGKDVDLLPGDGIQQYPADIRECDPGFEATSGSKPHIVAAIRELPPGSEAVVANHSETLYSIITETTGIDTSDPALFPKEDGSTTRVRNFNDLWVVRLPASGRGQLIRHYVFELTLRKQ